MIRTQRRAHLVIWMVIATSLPILMVLAIVYRPEPAIMPIHDRVKAVGEIIEETESGDLKANLRGIGGKVGQLEIQVKVPLQAPTAVVYSLDGRFIGQIGSKGVYRFDIPSSINGFTVVDEMGVQELAKLVF